MIIRLERPGDAPTISAVIQEAFRGHPHSVQNEHRIVDALRAAGALSLSLVAELDDTVVGHVAFSPVTHSGSPARWAGVGPLAVLRSRQRMGVGFALMISGMGAIREQGFAGAVLVGPPEYYRRFGFQNVPGLKIHGVPSEVILAKAFEGEVPPGEVAFHPAFTAV